MATYKEMSPGIFRVRQEVRKGWIPFAMNLYALPGETGLLFDAGSGAKRTIRHGIHALDAIEKETGKKVLQILPSHAHWDHFSGATALAKARHMEILLTEAMVPLVRTRQGYRKAYQDDEGALFPPGNILKKSLLSCKSRLVDELFACAAGMRAVTGPYASIAVGDTLKTDAGTWRVLAGPGHCNTHIMLWNPDSGILLGGDNVLANITTWLGPPRSNIADYQETLETIRDLPGLSLILPAHGPAITDPVKRTTQLITHRKKRLADIREKIRTAGPRGLSAHALVLDYYPNISSLKRGIAQGWIETTLLHLMTEGDVARTAEKGTWCYHLV